VNLWQKKIEAELRGIKPKVIKATLSGVVFY